MYKLLFIVLLPLATSGQGFTKEEINPMKGQAQNITIIRDNWGVPHVYGKTDADAAFRLMYAECEDNYWQMDNTDKEYLAGFRYILNKWLTASIHYDCDMGIGAGVTITY